MARMVIHRPWDVVRPVHPFDVPASEVERVIRDGLDNGVSIHRAESPCPWCKDRGIA